MDDWWHQLDLEMQELEEWEWIEECNRKIEEIDDAK